MTDPPHTGPTFRCEPPARRRVIYGAGAVLAGVLAILDARGPFGEGSRLPLAVGAAVLGLLAGLDLWLRPPLEADAREVRIRRGPRRAEHLPWTSITRIEAGSTTHRGLLPLASLEIDAGDRLFVLSRHRLGADPGEVAEALRSARPNGAPR